MIYLRYVDIRKMTLKDRQRLYEQAGEHRQKRANRYRQQEDFDRCIVAEALLRYGAGTGNYQVERTSRGKPFLKDRPEFHFNLTHSGPWVAIAWSDAPVGVDVEVFRENVQCQKLAGQFFCPDEQAYLQAEPSQELRRFFGLWTQKESYLKYLGTGLTKSLSSFSVLEPEKLGVCFTGWELEGAVMTLCANASEVDIQPLEVGQI